MPHNKLPQISEAEKERLRRLAPEDQFQRDIAIWEQYLINDDLSKTRRGIVKRLFYLLANVNFEIKHQLPKMPLASLLSHGGRIILQVPPLVGHDEADKLLYWLTGGKEAVLSSLISAMRKNVGDKAAKKNKPVFTRIAATHSLMMDAEHQLHEILVKPSVKGFKKKIKTWRTLIMNAIKKRHMGVNLGLDEPVHAAFEDGSHGHLYLFWRPPTHHKPGALMVGCEGSETGKSDKFGNTHDSKAKSGEFSPTGGTKFRDLMFLEHGFDIDEIDGIHVTLTQADINNYLAKYQESVVDKAFLSQPIKVKPLLRHGYSMSHIQQFLSNHYEIPKPTQEAREQNANRVRNIPWITVSVAESSCSTSSNLDQNREALNLDPNSKTYQKQAEEPAQHLTLPETRLTDLFATFSPTRHHDHKRGNSLSYSCPMRHR